MKLLQKTNNFQLIARTPHGAIQYNCKSAFIKVDSVIPYVNKKKYDSLCESGCPNYNSKWSCPPYAPDYITFTKSYEYLEVIMLLVNMQEFHYIKQDYLKIKAANSILKSRVDKALRVSKNKDEFYISTGSCRLCKPCKRKINQSCAHLTDRTFSFEALGVDVSSLVRDLFQKELLWYQNKILPEYTCVVAGLLTNNEVPANKVVRHLIELDTL